MRPRSLFIVLAAAAATLVLIPSLAGAQPATLISGEVGAITDPDASNGGFFLRFVGKPAPAGYSHAYQWTGPQTLTMPEDGPVVFDGQLNVAGREAGDVSMVGLLDRASLAAGNTDFQRGAYIYVFAQASGDIRIGVTDGNAGGEIVQVFLTIPAADVPANGILDVTFTVDGTADPSTCATAAADVATADGCMTLDVDGFGVVSDSYGTISTLAGTEFGDGAIAGWDAFPSGPTGVFFAFTVSPLFVPETRDDCINGGWEDYGFKNQGLCIRYVNTAPDQELD